MFNINRSDCPIKFLTAPSQLVKKLPSTASAKRKTWKIFLFHEVLVFLFRYNTCGIGTRMLLTSTAEEIETSFERSVLIDVSHQSLITSDPLSNSLGFQLTLKQCLTDLERHVSVESKWAKNILRSYRSLKCLQSKGETCNIESS